jgi:hypothetical protein
MTHDNMLKLCRDNPDIGVAMLLLGSKLDEQTFESMGHDLNISSFSCNAGRSAAFCADILPEDTRDLIRQAIQALIIEPAEKHAFVAGSVYCYQCHSRTPVHFDGKAFFLKDACAYNFKTLTVDVPVPSGKLLCGNDFRSVFPEVRHSVNQLAGIFDTTRDYAGHGMFFPTTSDTSASVDQISDSMIKIGYGGPHSICPDLTWLSFADESILQQWAEVNDKNWDAFVGKNVDFSFDIRPGLYRCSATLPEEDGGCKCTMEWLRELTPEDGVTFDKPVAAGAEDYYQQFLYGQAAGRFKSFGSFVVTMSAVGYDGADWFEDSYDAPTFMGHILKKYPDFDESLCVQALTGVKPLNEKIEFLATSMTMSGPNKGDSSDLFLAESHVVLRCIPYGAHYTRWASIMACLWTSLQRGQVTDQYRSAAHRTLTLCVMNLQERGLFDEALNWIESVRPLIDGRNHPKIIQDNHVRLESLRSLFECVHPAQSFDAIKGELALYI